MQSEDDGMGLFNGKHLSGKEKLYSKKNGYCYPTAMSCATGLPIEDVLKSVKKRGVKIQNNNGMTDHAAMRVVKDLGYTFAWGYHSKQPLLVTVKVGSEFHAIARNPEGTWCCNRSGHRQKSFQDLQKRLARWFREVDDKPEITANDVQLVQHIALWPIIDGGWELEVPDINEFITSMPKEYAKRQYSI